MATPAHRQHVFGDVHAEGVPATPGEDVMRLPRAVLAADFAPAGGAEVVQGGLVAVAVETLEGK